jgi:hypothetical protein
LHTGDILSRQTRATEIELNRTSGSSPGGLYDEAAAVQGRHIDLPSDDEQGMFGACIFLLQGRIDDERLEERSNDACTSVVQVGDYVMIWIDNFGTITAKVGMKRCVSKPSQAELCPWVEGRFLVGRFTISGRRSRRVSLCGRRFATDHVKVILADYRHARTTGEGIVGRTLFISRHGFRSRQICRKPNWMAHMVMNWHQFL